MQKEVTKERILSMIGMATRAGRTVSGMDAVVGALRVGIVFLVIVAEDASEKTKENVSFTAKNEDVPVFSFSERFTLGKFLGKEERVVCGITDEGFSNKLQQMLVELNKKKTDVVSV